MNRKQRRTEGANEKKKAKTAGAVQKLFTKALQNHQAGHNAIAKQWYQRVLAVDPGHADALHLLGVIAYQSKRYDLADELIHKAIFIDARVASYHSNLGLALQEQGRLEDAVICHRKAIDLQPDFSEAHNNLGLALQAQGLLDEAVVSFRRAIALNPGFAFAHNNLGSALEEQGWLDEAVASHRQALDLKPDYARGYNNLGVALRRQGQLDEAIACYRRAIDLAPGYKDVYNNLGFALGGISRFQDAFEAHLKALQLGADPGISYFGLSGCRKFTGADDPLIRDMQAACDASKTPDSGRAMLGFALGKIFDDLGEYGTAIRYFDQGNRLEDARHAFDRDNFTAGIDRLVAAFPGAEKLSVVSDSDLPVLIVGMPRSGTTLTEQILANHPDVAAGGELSFWYQKSHRIAEGMAGKPEHSAARAAIADYLLLLGGLSRGARRVTDKLPYNFLSLGLVSSLFPKARIIHCHRNPLDTALSIYCSRFSRSNEFAYSRNNIVHYYRQYQRLMAHWRKVLPPGQILDMDYEQLVSNPEAGSRRLVAFCGLDWNDACLDFHTSNRPVATLSAWQARQPIYRTSIERWRHYEPWLGTLAELAP
jgi:tetratricopeptide (TPR) repeat protein